MGGLVGSRVGCGLLGGGFKYSKNRGTPKWMVYIGQPYEQMDDFGGTIIFGNTHILYFQLLLGEIMKNLTKIFSIWVVQPPARFVCF